MQGDKGRRPDASTLVRLLAAFVPNNRIPDSTEVWIGRALVAASLDARLTAGQTRDKAASSIVKEYPSLKALTTAKAQSVKTAALNWYSEFNGERVKNTAAMKVFRAVRNHLQECGSLGQKEEIMDVARHTLSSANRIALRLSPHC